MQSLVCGNKVDNSFGCPFSSRMHVLLCWQQHTIYSCAGSTIYESGFYIGNWKGCLPPTTFGQHSYLTPSTQDQAATQQCSTGYNPLLCSRWRVVGTTNMCANDGAGEVAKTGAFQQWVCRSVSDYGRCWQGSLCSKCYILSDMSGKFRLACSVKHVQTPVQLFQGLLGV